MDIVTEKCKDCDGEGGHYGGCPTCDRQEYDECASCNGIGQIASITINGLTCKITLEIL